MTNFKISMMTKNPTLLYHLYDTLEDTNQWSDSKRLSDRLRNNRSGSKTGVERQGWRAHGKILMDMSITLMAVTAYRYVYASKPIRLYSAKMCLGKAVSMKTGVEWEKFGFEEFVPVK